MTVNLVILAGNVIEYESYNAWVEAFFLLTMGMEICFALGYELLSFSELVNSSLQTRRRLCLVLYSLAIVDAVVYWASDEGNRYRAYMYLALIVMQNQGMYRSFVNFVKAVCNASKVIWLFFCAQAVISSLALVLLSGKYTTSNYYVDQQYKDYLRCFVTVYTFLSTGANYTDAVNPSLQLAAVLVYCLFFLFCTMVGMFFIFSLLIDMFCSGFLNSTPGSMNANRKFKLESATCCLIMWQRGGLQQAEGNAEPPVLDCAAFAELMLQVSRGNQSLQGHSGLGWIRALQRKLNNTTRHFLKQPDSGTELHTLALLLADVHYPSEYHAVHCALTAAGVSHLPDRPQLRQRSPDDGSPTTLDSIRGYICATAPGHSQIVVDKSEAEVLSDVPTEGSLAYRLHQIPHWYGLTGATDPEAPHTTAVAEMTQLVALHKWRFSMIYNYCCAEEGEEEVKEENQTIEAGCKVLDLDRMMKLVHCSNKLIDSKSLMIEVMIQQVGNELADVENAVSDQAECGRLGRVATGPEEIEVLRVDLEKEVRCLEQELLEERHAMESGLWAMFSEEVWERGSLCPLLHETLLCACWCGIAYHHM